MKFEVFQGSTRLQNIYSVFICLAVSGCSHSPSRDILGSFFPSWMLCTLAGIFGCIVIRLIIAKSGIEVFIPAKLAVYGCLTVSMTLVTWLLFFGN